MVAPGKIFVELKCIGYFPQIVADISIKAGCSTTVNIQMVESAIPIKGLTINPD